MRQFILLIFALFFVFISCKNNASSSDQSNHRSAKDSTTAPLPNKEIDASKTTSISSDSSLPNQTNDLSNAENLIGEWLIPHNATITIKFDKNGKFEFNDFNSKLNKDELLKGTYQLENEKLTLFYDDRPKQSFKFYKGKKGDAQYYLEKGSYYFVKAD